MALASYGQNYRESGRITAKHVQKILAGVPPKDVPVENYDKIALVLNLRVAGRSASPSRRRCATERTPSSSRAARHGSDGSVGPRFDRGCPLR